MVYATDFSPETPIEVQRETAPDVYVVVGYVAEAPPKRAGFRHANRSTNTEAKKAKKGGR